MTTTKVDDLISTSELAERVGVSRQTIQAWRAAGRIEPSWIAGEGRTAPAYWDVALVATLKGD